jgi:hypothetical protein
VGKYFLPQVLDKPFLLRLISFTKIHGSTPYKVVNLMVTAMATLNCKKMVEGTIFCRPLKSRAAQRHHDEQKCIPAACGYKHQDNVSSYVQE